MNTRIQKILSLAITIVLAASWAQAKGPKISEPSKVDKDYAIQGEYSGMLEADGDKTKLGVQVIAQGQGKFQAVIYEGGLPGDGWDQKKDLERINAPLENGQVVFKAKKGTGIVKAGKMHITDSDNQPMGVLKRLVRTSSTLGKKPPKGATVLFDGSNVNGWKNGRMTADKLLMEGTTSTETFQDHQLHIEFRLPYQPEDRGQGRGNSGLYVQGRYEVQMLDSFGLAGKQNECGGLYSVKDPDVNMCYPPLQWQTYDIQYTAARFDAEGKLTKHPKITVRHNGVVIHNDVELPGNRSTTAAPSKPGPVAGPIYLQNHGSPMRYRNIWAVKASGSGD
ncbi:MAG: DUF1080 domain-containing protein [Pirellulaceae bacterium]